MILVNVHPIILVMHVPSFHCPGLHCFAFVLLLLLLLSLMSKYSGCWLFIIELGSASQKFSIRPTEFFDKLQVRNENFAQPKCESTKW